MVPASPVWRPVWVLDLVPALVFVECILILRTMIRLLMDALIAVATWSNTCLAPLWWRILMNHVDISSAMKTMLTFILVLLTVRLVAIILEEDVPSHVAMHFSTLGIGLVVTICA
jgi:hypothetical protein